VAKAYISLPATKVRLANSVSLLIGLAFVSQLAPLHAMPPAAAADFSRAKKIYVPPTRIPRRFDSESASTDADTYSAPSDPGYTTPSTYSPKSGRVSGKNGLIPPPPPLTPTLLPPSLLHMPPQTSGSTSSSAGTSPAKPATQRWSVAVQKNLKRASNSPKVASFIDQAQSKAQNLINEGKLDQAQQMLKDYVKALPRDAAIKNEFAKVSVQRAQQLLSDQNIDAAGRMAREALSVQPQNQAAHTVLAQVMKKQGLSAESSPDRVKAANALLAKGKVSEAAMEFESANKLKPSADAYVGLGDIALKSNNKDKAKLEYQKALELEPHSGPALRQMGIIRLGQSDVVGANSDLSRALVINPNDKVASKHLLDLWQKQVTNSPQSANSHFGLARAHQLSGDLQSAQAEYRTVVQIDPNNPNLPAARQSFKLALARQEASRAVESAHTLESAGSIQAAHAKVTEAVNLCPGDSAFKMYQAQLSEKLDATSNVHSSFLTGTPYTTNSGTTGASTAATGLAATAAGLLPGLTPPAAPSYRNLGVSAGQAFNGGVAEAPPAMALDGIPKVTPASSTPQVSSMSGFLSSLRNLSVQQKYQSQQMEDAAHTALNGIANPASLTSTPSPDDASISQSPVLASASANLAGVQNLLASIGASSSTAAAGAAAGAGAGVSVSSAAAAGTASPDSIGALLGQSASSKSLSTLVTQANPAFKTKKLLTKNDMNQLYQKAQQRYSLGNSSNAASPAAASAAAPAAPSLEEQNKQLQSQLQAAQQQLTAMRAQPTLQAETPAASPLSSGTSQIAGYTPLPSEASAATTAALSLAPNAANASVQSILQSMPPSLTSSEGFQSALAGMPNSAAALQTYAATLPPATQMALQAALKPPIATPHSMASGAVRLELEGVKPSPLDIKLNVVLRNDQKIALNVSTSTKAIIRMTGEPQRVVKISFPSNNVPPNGVLHGVVRVPGHNLSPSADLFIPDMLPGAGADRDLHLTVPISLK
jgi:tetratricopeptide (TPR) repeat protein